MIMATGAMNARATEMKSDTIQKQTNMSTTAMIVRITAEIWRIKHGRFDQQTGGN